jgi:chemotaxis protein MotB
MADDDEENGPQDPPPKCPECVKGLPAWMATFSDLVTLLLTFFVLLLSFAKTETQKYESALGSIRKAFGGNTEKIGQVPSPGKSPDDSPTMMDSQDPVKPFPIDFLTTEGFLDKHEMNRNSEEDLNEMKYLLKEYGLADNVDVFEINEGLKVKVKDKLYFKEGSTKLDKINVEVFERLVNLLKDNKWVLFIEAFSAHGERSPDKSLDAMELSSKRAMVVSRVLANRGVDTKRIVPVFYGDNKVTGAKERSENRKVQFFLRKKGMDKTGSKVDVR